MENHIKPYKIHISTTRTGTRATEITSSSNANPAHACTTSAAAARGTASQAWPVPGPLLPLQLRLQCTSTLVLFLCGKRNAQEPEQQSSTIPKILIRKANAQSSCGQVRKMERSNPQIMNPQIIESQRGRRQRR